MNSKRYSKVPDPRSQGCCSINFLKYTFVVFNVLYCISGVFLALAGYWTLHTHSSYLALMDTPSYSIIVWMLLYTGVAVAVGGVLGCVGVRLEQRCLLALYILIIVGVFLSELILALFSYVYYEQVGQDLQKNLRDVFINSYYLDKDRTRAIDVLQQELCCCGSDSFEDWGHSAWYTTASKRNRVPDSCCKTMSEGCGVRDHPSNIAYTGCRHGIQARIQSRLKILCALGLGFSLLQLAGFVYSVSLFCQLTSFRRRLEKERKEAESKSNPRNNLYINGYHPVYSDGKLKYEPPQIS